MDTPNTTICSFWVNEDGSFDESGKTYFEAWFLLDDEYGKYGMLPEGYGNFAAFVEVKTDENNNVNVSSFTQDYYLSTSAEVRRYARRHERTP